VYSHDIKFPLFGTYVTTPMQNFHPVYMNQWNLSVQRQIGRDWLLTANYVGNSTIHMISSENINPAVYVYNGTNVCTLPNGITITGPAGGAQCSTVANQQSRRALSLQNLAQGQYYSSIGIIDDGGTASYEGLFLSAQKRMSRGLSAQVNYTLSHCISDVYQDNPGSAGWRLRTIEGNSGATVSGSIGGNCLGSTWWRRHPNSPIQRCEFSEVTGKWPPSCPSGPPSFSRFTQARTGR